MNSRRDEGEKYRGSSGPVSGGEWKLRAKESAGRTLRSGNLNAAGPVGGPGPPLHGDALSEPGEGPPAGGKLGGTAERSIRPNTGGVLRDFFGGA